MKIILNHNENQLMLMGITDIKKMEKKVEEWSIHKDRMGVYMIFYKNIPVDEIIYAVGEISLAFTDNITTLQGEYYEEGYGDVFNIAVKLVRDALFSKEFYRKYKEYSEKL